MTGIRSEHKGRKVGTQRGGSAWGARGVRGKVERGRKRGGEEMGGEEEGKGGREEGAGGEG